MRYGTSGSLLSGFLCLAVLSLNGCGSNRSNGSGSSGTGPIPGAFTKVAIELSSTANGRFANFALNLNSISLTNKAGDTTTIYSTPADVEFVRLNGTAIPFATVSVPQDVYTSAAVSLNDPGFMYTFMDATGSVNLDFDVYKGTYALVPPVVTLPAPITVEGSTMGLTLSMQVASSGTFTGMGPQQTSYAITPTFTLRAFPLTAQSTSPANGSCIGLTGQVGSADAAAGSFTFNLSGKGAPQPYQSTVVSLNAATVYQGITGASELADGTFVNLDLALQSDASYVATRVEVQDPATVNVTSGQLLEVIPSYDIFSPLQLQQQGGTLATNPLPIAWDYTYNGTTKFQTSARFPNLASLPFTAVFNSSTMTAGQMVSVGTLSYVYMGGYTLPDSVTLIPQTIDGVVNASSSSGNYTVYTVQLASYDLIVQMNSSNAPKAATVLRQPQLVEVYVNAQTALDNATTLQVGGTFRFNGLLFNDAGTLRLVAGQVSDGVAQ